MSILKRLRNHVVYSERAKKWAERAVKYTEADDTKRAKDATRKASYWLRKAMEIETVYRRTHPHD